MNKTERSGIVKRLVDSRIALAVQVNQMLVGQAKALSTFTAADLEESMEEADYNNLKSTYESARAFVAPILSPLNQSNPQFKLAPVFPPPAAE